MREVEPIDDDGFMQKLTQSQRSLLGFIVGMTPTMADADDVLQEVNLALWKKRHQYDSKQTFLRWAFAFATVELRRFRDRAASKRLWASDALLESLAEEYPQEPTLAEQRCEALASCMEKLGPTEHWFITEFYAKQHSAQDLAASSGRQLRTVYKILTRARRGLRECIERNLERQSRSA